MIDRDRNDVTLDDDAPETCPLCNDSGVVLDDASGQPVICDCLRAAAMHELGA